MCFSNKKILNYNKNYALKAFCDYLRYFELELTKFFFFFLLDKRINAKNQSLSDKSSEFFSSSNGEFCFVFNSHAFKYVSGSKNLSTSSGF